MRKAWLSLIALSIMGFLSACELIQMPATSPTPTAESIQVRLEPPSEYAAMKNPFTLKDEEAIQKGQALYVANCSSCHGEKGLGDGPAGVSLNPKPSNLAQAQNGLSDAYLFWRISEGGMMQPFNSLMPAWKALLSEQQIWQVITYIRSLGG